MKYSEETLKSWTAPLSKTEEDRAENAIKMIKKAISETIKRTIKGSGNGF